jgi:uncharacterized protein YcgI (DUF1989 family)
MPSPSYEGARYDTVMEPKAYLALELDAGEVMRIEDVDGVQCADIAFFSRGGYDAKKAQGSLAQSDLEHYSQQVTASRNKSVYLGKGYRLYTNLCNPIMTVVDDTVGHHDVISAWCNPETNYSRWGDIAIGKRTCKENIQDALAPYGIRVELPCTFNIFMDFEIAADGKIVWKETLSKPGDYIDLRAEMDVIVAVSNCPMEINAANGFNPTRLRVAVFPEDVYWPQNPGATREVVAVDVSV